jgi:hypothetical protein
MYTPQYQHSRPTARDGEVAGASDQQYDPRDGYDRVPYRHPQSAAPRRYAPSAVSGPQWDEEQFLRQRFEDEMARRRGVARAPPAMMSEAEYGDVNLDPSIHAGAVHRQESAYAHVERAYGDGRDPRQHGLSARAPAPQSRVQFDQQEMVSSNGNGRSATQNVTRKSKIAPVNPASTNCTRVTVVCLVFLAILAPALIIAGGVFATTGDPQEAQIGEFRAAEASFESGTANVLLTTVAITLAELPPRTLSPAYQLLTGTPFPESRTVVLYSADKAAVAETLGPNLGSVTAKVTYRQGLDSTVGQTYTFVSPPITLTRPATKPVSCTPAFASICGTTTCCTATEMQRQCLTIVRSFSQSSSVSYVPNGRDCRLGALCGTCAYRQTVSALCFVLRWSALTGWSADESKSSCVYPFLPTGQTYSDSDSGATLTLRASDDPLLLLQASTQGTLVLQDDGGAARSKGRGLILFGSLALLLGLCVAVLAKVCGADVLTTDAVQRAFGIRPRGPDDGGLTRNPASQYAVKTLHAGYSPPASPGGAGPKQTPPPAFDRGDEFYQHDQPPAMYGFSTPVPRRYPYQQDGSGGGGGGRSVRVDLSYGDPESPILIAAPLASFREMAPEAAARASPRGRRWHGRISDDDEL